MDQGTPGSVPVWTYMSLDAILEVIQDELLFSWKVPQNCQKISVVVVIIARATFLLGVCSLELEAR